VETWTEADGTVGRILVADNVEAYAPGSPIFAWSGDDFLTGSAGGDLFVFSHPIGNDTVYNFDVAADQIDLIGYTGFTSFADVQSHLAEDTAGNAVLTLGDSQSIMLHGIHADWLTASDFVFEQEPVTNNAGTLIIGDGAMLPLSGIIDNMGTIALNSAGAETDLQLIRHGITLQGGGQVILSDNGGNVIAGTASDVTLTNVDNTISGAGQLGAGQLALTNQGTIIASGVNALIVDTGANALVNGGTLEATGSGGLSIAGDVANTGLLWANGGNLIVGGAAIGNGSALISGSATLEFAGASSQTTTFASGATGLLKLHDSLDFSGSVSGFDDGDRLDLHDIQFESVTIGYTANADNSGGILNVSDGVHAAHIALLGDYGISAFGLSADDNAGTLISYNHALLA